VPTETQDLQTGTYTPHTDVDVYYWPAPDKNGTGDAIWENKTDNQGNGIGRDRKKDRDGNVVKLYPVPEGFIEMQSSDNSKYYVLANESGNEPWRNQAGEAVTISPGEAVAIYPDGKVERMPDEYSRYLFSERHASKKTTTSQKRTTTAS
jgi:hypothetical protein